MFTFTTTTKSEWPKEPEEIIEEILRAKDEWDEYHAAVDRVTQVALCKCPDGFVQIIDRFSSDDRRAALHHDEVATALSTVGHLLVGIRWCQACDQRMALVIDRDRLALLRKSLHAPVTYSG